jgi:Na+-driven multidrug efflux pump
LLDEQFNTANDNWYQLEEVENEPLLQTKVPKKEIKLSILGNLSKSKIFMVQLKTIYYLMPNIFSSGDFLMAVVILKLLISSTQSSALKSATEFHNSILEILVFTFNFGLTETLGIYGAQAYSKGKKERLRLLLEQCTWIGISFFAIVCTPVYYLSKDMIRIFGNEDTSFEETNDVFKNIVLYSLPGVFLKIITDCYKTFIYCQGKYFLLGCLSLVNLALMGFYGHFFIIKL